MKAGAFVTEYCGEVLDEVGYLQRKKQYMSRGQR
jgi:hypothetical protein